MTRYSAAQIAQVAKGAGFSGNGLIMSVAVALAESNGDPQAVNVNSDKYRSVDRGLWQINNHWHPEVSAAEAFAPATAAKHAYRISSGGSNWSQWATAKNGMAQAQLARATIGARQASGGTVTTPVGLDLGDLTKVPGAIKDGAGDLLGGAGDLAGKLWGGAGDLLGGAGDLLGGAGDLGGAIASPITGIVAPLVGLAKAASTVTSLYVKAAVWLANKRNWGRIAQVGLGGAALLIGLKMLSSTGVGPAAAAGRGASKAAGAAKKAVKTTTEVGAQVGLAVATGGTSAAAGAAAKGGQMAAKGASAAKAAKGAGSAAKGTAKAAAAGAYAGAK